MGASYSYEPWKSESVDVLCRETKSDPNTEKEAARGPVRQRPPPTSDPTGFVRKRWSLRMRPNLKKSFTSVITPEVGVAPAFCWSVYRVGEWISNIGYPQYKQCFTTNRVDGKKLIYFREISNFPKIGICDFEHMKAISKAIRALLGVDVQPLVQYERYVGQRSIASPPDGVYEMYLEAKARTGATIDRVNYEQYKIKHRDLFDRSRGTPEHAPAERKWFKRAQRERLDALFSNK